MSSVMALRCGSLRILETLHALEVLGTLVTLVTFACIGAVMGHATGGNVAVAYLITLAPLTVLRLASGLSRVAAVVVELRSSQPSATSTQMEAEVRACRVAWAAPWALFRAIWHLVGLQALWESPLSVLLLASLVALNLAMLLCSAIFAKRFEFGGKQPESGCLQLEGLTHRAFTVDAHPEAGGEVCSICLDHFASGERLLELLCGHRFHEDCIRRWILASASGCPLRCPTLGGPAKAVADPDELSRSGTAATIIGREGRSSAMATAGTPSEADDGTGECWGVAQV